jgi:hypothetical protein
VHPHTHSHTRHTHRGHFFKVAYKNPTFETIQNNLEWLLPSCRSPSNLWSQTDHPPVMSLDPALPQDTHIHASVCMGASHPCASDSRTAAGAESKIGTAVATQRKKHSSSCHLRICSFHTSKCTTDYLKRSWRILFNS